jgi:protein-disulfide isomerase
MQTDPRRLRRGLMIAIFLVSIGTLTVQAQTPPFSISASTSAPGTGSVSLPGSSITILVFSDFGSFPCARSASVLSGLLAEHREIQVIFKHAPAITIPNSVLVHEAALAAGAQGKFREMHDLLFTNQKRLELDDLIRYATEIHLDLGAFRQALDQHTFTPAVERDLAEAHGLGVNTTPTFFINGRRLVGAQGVAAFEAVIDSVLAGVKREPPKPAVVRPEDIAIEHAPLRGSPSAPVAIVQFSDFECGYCAAEVGVLKELLKAYPNRVRWFFKHYPLPFHKSAPLAHEAALAAGEQGKFWEMHDLLFEEPQAIAHDDLVKKAKRLKLDMARFETDLDSRRFKPVVEAERQEGMKLGVDGTPFFFINGRAVSSALPLEEIKKIVEAEMKKLPQ